VVRVLSSYGLYGKLTFWDWPVFNGYFLGSVEDDRLHGCWEIGHFGRVYQFKVVGVCVGDGIELR
jgi:hypothetical protein